MASDLPRDIRVREMLLRAKTASLGLGMPGFGISTRYCRGQIQT